MDRVRRGDWLMAQGANGTTRELRALGEIIAGGDFAVVWACSPAEWDSAHEQAREPEGIPWPAEDVAVVEHVAA